MESAYRVYFHGTRGDTSPPREREKERRAQKLHVNVQFTRDSTYALAVHHKIVHDYVLVLY